MDTLMSFVGLAYLAMMTFFSFRFIQEDGRCEEQEDREKRIRFLFDEFSSPESFPRLLAELKKIRRGKLFWGDDFFLANRAFDLFSEGIVLEIMARVLLDKNRRRKTLSYLVDTHYLFSSRQLIKAFGVAKSLVVIRNWKRRYPSVYTRMLQELAPQAYELREKEKEGERLRFVS